MERAVMDERRLLELNLRTLQQRFYTPAATRAAAMIEQGSDEDLQTVLESHLVQLPSPSRARAREDLDELLRYYSVIELASMVGAVPRPLPDPMATRMRLHLERRFVKTYYTEYYPLLLPRLLLARLHGEPVKSGADDQNNADLLMSFLDVSSICETPASRAFLRLLDDGAVGGRGPGLREVLATLRSPDRLAHYLATPSERQTPAQRGLEGLSDVMRFARALNQYLGSMAQLAVWQSACWHYHGGCFQQLAGRVAGAITAAVALFRTHVPATADEVQSDLNALAATLGVASPNSMESMTDAISATHGSMDETTRALQILTSGIYRAALDAYALTGELPIIAITDAPSAPAGVRDAQPAPRVARGTRPQPMRTRNAGGLALPLSLIEPAVAMDVAPLYAALENALAVTARKYYSTREPLEAVLDPGTGNVAIFATKEVVKDESHVDDPYAQWPLNAAREIDPEAQVGGVIKLDYISKEVVDVVRDPHTQIRIHDAQMIDSEVEQGDEVKIPLTTPPADLARIAAQSAKQVFYQKVREAERAKVFNEFKDKMGELENGYVKRFERGDMIIDLNGKTEGIISRHHQSRGERYSQGDRIIAVVLDVSNQPRGPQVVLSRTDPRLLIKLFELKVPEIYDGTVVIKGAVREPGERAKIAVMSRDRNVDPVGACVGKKGSRVQSIIRELRGEKIDIVPWHEDIVTYVRNALAPAKITRVSVTSDEQAHRPHLDVIVDNDQLAIAIGKRGLNVRLAAELIGARIDIKSEEEIKGEVADALAAMLQEAMAESRAQVGIRDIENLPEGWAQLLEDAGYDDLDSIINSSVEDLTAIEGVDDEMAEKILVLARKHEQVEMSTGEDASEAEQVEAADEFFDVADEIEL